MKTDDGYDVWTEGLRPRGETGGVWRLACHLCIRLGGTAGRRTQPIGYKVPALKCTTHPRTSATHWVCLAEPLPQERGSDD